jgi:hypothetical protein
MHKDCKIEKKIIILILKINPNTYLYKMMHSYFTSYKKKFRKIIFLDHLKNNLNVYTYTKIKNQRKKFQKLMKTTSISHTYQCKKRVARVQMS